MIHENLNVNKVNDNLFKLEVGEVILEMNLIELKKLSKQIANTLNIKIVDEKELQNTLQRFEALQVRVPTLAVSHHKYKANLNSTRKKPLGG